MYRKFIIAKKHGYLLLPHYTDWGGAIIRKRTSEKTIIRMLMSRKRSHETLNRNPYYKGE